MFQLRVEVVLNLPLGGSYYKMGLHAPEVAHSASPGQFVMVKVSPTLDPLLRRPFSIHRLSTQGIPKNRGGFELLYKVVGKGTETMSRFETGDYIDIIGPLGKGFSISPSTQVIYLVAGGVGVAPLLALAESATIDKQRKMVIFLGGKDNRDILCLEDFKKLGMEIYITTEDGSLGEKGLVTKLLEEILRKPSHPQAIYACGPLPMLRKIAFLAQSLHISCQISLEAHMACGVGACLGCVVKKRLNKGIYSFVNVCKEGPVFDAQRVIYDD